MNISRWLLVVPTVALLTGCGPAAHALLPDVDRLGQTVGLGTGDTSRLVLVVNASMCFSCDASLAPYLDVVRRGEPGVTIWVWEKPTAEERSRLAAERIHIAGVVPAELRRQRRAALVMWASGDGAVRSGSALDATAARSKK